MNARAAATIPAQDLERAKRWYSEKLGFTPQESPAGVIFELSDGTGFLLFSSNGKASGDHTQMALEVDDVDGTVKELKGRGVRFEEYDLPGLKTVDGIADFEGARSAWFKDSEGNLLAVGPRIPVGARS